MATITEDYVSFEIAKLLKEKEFDGKSCVYYNEFGEIMPIKHISSYIECPTQQMARKWLIRKYRLYVNVVPSVEGCYWTEKWHSYVEDLNKRYPFGKFIGTFNSPEEAAETAIKYCLENLI